MITNPTTEGGFERKYFQSDMNLGISPVTLKVVNNSKIHIVDEIILNFP